MTRTLVPYPKLERVNDPPIRCAVAEPRESSTIDIYSRDFGIVRLTMYIRPSDRNIDDIVNNSKLVISELFDGLDVETLNERIKRVPAFMIHSSSDKIDGVIYKYSYFSDLKKEMCDSLGLLRFM